MSEWIATYRLQLHCGFPLSAAEEILPYLAALGVSHVYLSPCLQAATGSAHGYDVADPRSISTELGGEAAWARFVDATKAAGLNILLDIVPNHMVTAADNPWWDDVLTHGPFSDFASFFDVHAQPLAPWRVHLAVLARAYGDCLEAGELTLESVGAMPRLRHHDANWPIGPVGWSALLGAAADQPCLAELEALGREPSPGVELRERYRELRAAANRALDQSRERGDLDSRIAAANADPELLDAILQSQFYTLHGWRRAAEVTNYRRFFDVDTLIGVRVELPEVRAATHRRIEQMIGAGDVDGLRVDHPDGLKQPFEYFRFLRGLVPGGRVYVEKILENEEHLPGQWPIDGSVGYEFLAKSNRLWMDDRRTDSLTSLYADFTGQPVDFGALVREKKRAMFDTTFRPDAERLTSAALALAAKHWRTRDIGRRHLREALARISVALPVYRTYRTKDAVPSEERRVIGDAVQLARMGASESDVRALDFLERLLTRDCLDDAQTDFVEAWQQLTPAVMAKGVEDTTFYCFDRLVSCNEVGSQASLLGISADQFHEFCHDLSEHWPRNLLATSTHDNKRSEDVRTRISLLSEIPDRWAEALHRWAALNAPAWRHRVPDRHAEYLLYQTLIGAWPIDQERCHRYMVKACREAKLKTSWRAPNAGYEESIREFIAGVFASAVFLAELLAFVQPLVLAGRVNSLAQTLIKLTAPGVPDFYQGTELWDLSLVDPDNRRPVDFTARAALLDLCRGSAVAEVVRQWDSGLPKLWMVHRTLALRQAEPALFSGLARHQPLVAQGTHLGRLLAYQRGDDLVTVVPRFGLTRGDGWADTRLPLPEGRWRNTFTEAALEGVVSPDELFGAFPVALLRRTVP